MPATVVVGTQSGDEGKGKVKDRTLVVSDEPFTAVRKQFVDGNRRA